MNEFELRRSLGNLPRQRRPRGDLWPRIETSLNASEATPRWRLPWWAAAAAMLLAALIVPAQFERRTTQPHPMLATALTYPAAVDDGVITALPAWVVADPTVAAALAELEEVAFELHQLIEEHPHTPHLVTLLHATYEQQRWLSRNSVGYGQMLPPQES